MTPDQDFALGPSEYRRLLEAIISDPDTPPGERFAAAVSGVVPNVDAIAAPAADVVEDGDPRRAFAALVSGQVVDGVVICGDTIGPLMAHYAHALEAFVEEQDGDADG